MTVSPIAWTAELRVLTAGCKPSAGVSPALNAVRRFLEHFPDILATRAVTHVMEPSPLND